MDFHRPQLGLIISDEPWAKEAIRNPNVGSDGLPYIDLPYMVLMKLQASRVQDIADISRMLGSAQEKTLKRVRTVVQCHLPDAVEDLESLIILGKLEIKG